MTINISPKQTFQLLNFSFESDIIFRFKNCDAVEITLVPAVLLRSIPAHGLIYQLVASLLVSRGIKSIWTTKGALSGRWSSNRFGFVSIAKESVCVVAVIVKPHSIFSHIDNSAALL